MSEKLGTCDKGGTGGWHDIDHTQIWSCVNWREQPAQGEPRDVLVNCPTCNGTGMGIEGEKEGCENCNGRGYGVSVGDKATERETRPPVSDIGVMRDDVAKAFVDAGLLNPPSPSGMSAEPLRKSDLGGFRGWNNPDRFIQEIEILLAELAKLREERDALTKTNKLLRANWKESERRTAIAEDDAERAESALASAQEALEQVKVLCAEKVDIGAKPGTCPACGSTVRDIRFDIKLHSTVMGEHWMHCFHPWHDAKGS